jgi:hemolysin-activating ACP:hemolysin acyltransferase
MTDKDYNWLISIMADSDYYKDQEISWLNEYINRPISKGQYIISREKAQFFCTYATPTDKQIDDYLENGYIDPNVFDNKGDSLWVIDFIAVPYEENVIRSLRTIKDVLCSQGYRQCFWLRNLKNKIGWHEVKSDG